MCRIRQKEWVECDYRKQANDQRQRNSVEPIHGLDLRLSVCQQGSLAGEGYPFRNSAVWPSTQLSDTTGNWGFRTTSTSMLYSAQSMKRTAGATAVKPKPSAGTTTDEVILAIEQRRRTVIDVIRSAQKRLLISLFRCTDVQVLDAIAEARDRGVKIKLILTPRARGWEKRLKELSAYLDSMGVMVHHYSDPVVKYHAKYFVADDGPALVGSM